jgi:hypothetical protein
MRTQAAKLRLSRVPALAASFGLIVIAFLQPARTANAVARFPQCGSVDQTIDVYYNNAQHQLIVGEAESLCNGEVQITGTVTAFYTFSCYPCS